MLKVFTHSFPKAEGFALNVEKLWVPRPEQLGGNSKREETLVPEITNQPPATRRGEERTQWKEMLCVLPAEGGGCTSGCSPPLATKD